MKFIIRDDDLNYFSQPSDIEEWYADIFAQNIPVGFSTVPLVKPVSDVYTGDLVSGDREYAISKNERLISYINHNPNIEILQHGTTHETIKGVFEYAREVDPNEATRGKVELERAFGKKMEVFVPPHDWIGVTGLNSVIKSGIPYIIRGRSTGIRNVRLRWKYLSVFFLMIFFKFLHRLKDNFIPAYPYVLNFGTHKEMCSYRLEDKDVFLGLKHAKETEGVFVVVTHLHYYTSEKKQLLADLILLGREYKAEFLRPSEIFKE